MPSIKKNLNEIQTIIKPLIGQKAWNVSLEHDEFITLEFGKICQSKENKAKIYGEWHLWIYCCAWRLERRDTVIAGFGDDRKKLEEAIKQLEGLTIQSIELLNPAFDTIFTFDQKILLRSFSVYSEEYEHWMLFTPDKNVLVLGPGTDWSYEQSND